MLSCTDNIRLFKFATYVVLLSSIDSIWLLKFEGYNKRQSVWLTLTLTRTTYERQLAKAKYFWEQRGVRRVFGSTYKQAIQWRRNVNCNGSPCRECKATVHRFTMSELKLLVFSSTSLRARSAAYEQQVLLKINSTAATYHANKLLLTRQGKKHDLLSASVMRRNASGDMNYIYMCNSNSALQNDVTKQKKHDQMNHSGLGICDSSHRLKTHQHDYK